MLKQWLLLIVLSILAVLFLSEVHQILHVLVTAHYAIVNTLATIYIGGDIGRIIRSVIALLLIPLIIGLIINLVYWVITRRSVPILMPIVWAVWLLLIALLG